MLHEIGFKGVSSCFVRCITKHFFCQNIAYFLISVHNVDDFDSRSRNDKDISTGCHSLM